MGGVLSSRKTERQRKQSGLRTALALSCVRGQVPEPVVPFPGTDWRSLLGSVTHTVPGWSRILHEGPQQCQVCWTVRRHWTLLPFPSSQPNPQQVSGSQSICLASFQFSPTATPCHPLPPLAHTLSNLLDRKGEVTFAVTCGQLAAPGAGSSGPTRAQNPLSPVPDYQLPPPWFQLPQAPGRVHYREGAGWSLQAPLLPTLHALGYSLQRHGKRKGGGGGRQRMVMPVHQTLPRALRRPVNMEKEPKMEWGGLKELGPVAPRVLRVPTAC